MHKRRDYMMKCIIAGIALALLTGCSVFTPHDSLVGQWKSNEEKSLASMNATEGVSDLAKNLFEHNVFGKVTMEYTAEGVRALRDDGFADPRYAPYKLVESTYSYYVVEIYNDTLRKNVAHKLYKEGDCYYTLVTKWNFHEYFCKVK